MNGVESPATPEDTDDPAGRGQAGSLLRRHAPARLPARRRAWSARLSLSDLFALKAAGAATTSADVNRIALMLVGAPASSTRGHEADAPTRSGTIQADPDQRVRHPDQRDLPAWRSSPCAAAIRVLFRRGGARRRSPGDADRPAVPAGLDYPNVGSILGYVKGANGDILPHVLLPRPIGNTGGNMPTARRRGISARPMTPSCSARTRPTRVQGARPAAARTSPRSVPISGGTFGISWTARCAGSKRARTHGC